jgi:hypothetical protein
MPLTVLLAPGDLMAQGDDLWLTVQLLPPPLMLPTLHPFLAFDRRIGPLPTARLEQAGLPDALRQGVQ